METEPAPDINDIAWDPERDSRNERVSLLAELDSASFEHASHFFDPARRLRHGRPLGERAAALLLGATFDDLETTVNRINAYAGYDDDDEREALEAAITEYEELLGQHRVLRRDSDERTIERMPVESRRRARAAQQRIDRLRRARYDIDVVRRRNAAAAVPRLVAALAKAREESERDEVARLERLLARARETLGLD